MRAYLGLIPAVLIATTLSGGAPVRADRGHFVISSAQPNVSVYGEGQKAIIGWNGTEEVLILSTDVSTSADATVLEFLPLPSKPIEVKKTDRTPFDVVQGLIRSRAMELHEGMRDAKVTGRGVEVVFHEKIGAHDIAIARTTSADEFVAWMKDYVAGRGMTIDSQRAARLRPMVASYITDGYKYFVCDVIELGSESKSVEPIMYRFKSSKLFFPLRVSSLDSGRVAIDLFLLTKERVDVWGTGTGFASGFYYSPSRELTPVKFKVPKSSVDMIHPAIGRLFAGDAWLGTATYRGRLAALHQDFVAE